MAAACDWVSVRRPPNIWSSLLGPVSAQNLGYPPSGYYLHHFVAFFIIVLTVLWIRIRIHEGKNYPPKSAWCSLLRAEGFSCSLNVLYQGLGISKLQKIKIYFSAVFFFFLSCCSSKPETVSGSGSGFTWNAGRACGISFSCSWGLNTVTIAKNYSLFVH